MTAPRTPRILFCSHLPVVKTLGASKVLVEVADGMRACGWDCTLLGPEHLDPAGQHGPGPTFHWFGPALRQHLRAHAGDYDVVEYDHVDLPFPRTDFPADTLMVARSVLLLHHLLTIRIPRGPTLKQRLAAPVRRWQADRIHRRWVAAADQTMAAANLINVANDHDRRALVAGGMSTDKIVVLPYGIGVDRRAAFDAVPEAVPAGPPRVAFVGTFDYRKGAREMPDLFARVIAAVPDARFKLLGTASMFTTVDQVLAHFPARLHERIEVVPRFAPDALPTLLADCWAGVFPSWLEGFGIGVLEMMAAAVPVVAYDAPGPPEMLPTEQLVRPGDSRAMAAIVVRWLTRKGELAAARRRARADSRRFDWRAIGRATGDAYLARRPVSIHHSSLTAGDSR